MPILSALAVLTLALAAAPLPGQPSLPQIAPAATPPVATVAASMPARVAPATLAFVPAPVASPGALDRDRVAALIALAVQPGLSPERQAARDALFRDVRPQLMRQGEPPSPQDADELRRALSTVPCASGRLTLMEAVVHGDVAYVSAAGTGGGCQYLLRRDGDRWAELLPLAWTVRN